jgi:hypothetical protein
MMDAIISDKAKIELDQLIEKVILNAELTILCLVDFIVKNN